MSDNVIDGANNYAYDAENRMITGPNASYVYDADGRRVRKTVSGVSSDYLYDLSGQMITVLNSGGGWIRGEVYAQGQHLSTYANSTVYFAHGDWLGTERRRTDIYGSGVNASVIPYADCTSLPFGDGFGCTGTDWSQIHYTGYDHDGESGLEHSWFRYYNTRIGRFMTPDPYDGSMDITNPQSFNRYAYVGNNPINAIDPRGLDCVYLNDAGDKIDEIATEIGAGECMGSGANGGGYYVEGTFDGFGILDNGNYTFSSHNNNGDNFVIGFGGGAPVSATTSVGNFSLYGLSALTAQVMNAVAPGSAIGLEALTPASDIFDPNGRLFGTHYCGPGGGGSTVNGTDEICQKHDQCFTAAGLTYSAQSPFHSMTFSQNASMQSCNNTLCNGIVSQPQPLSPADKSILFYFSHLSKNACHP